LEVLVKESKMTKAGLAIYESRDSKKEIRLQFMNKSRKPPASQA
jgi:hypothetical protein